jgi:hypothetical protein
MFKRVALNDIGTKLIENQIYTCRFGDLIMKGRFCYCPDEYWWVDPLTGKEIKVQEWRDEDD